MWHLVLLMFIRYVYFIRYLALHAVVTIILPLFGHPNVAAIQMSRSDIVIFCHLFSNPMSADLSSGVISSPIDVIFLWLEYDLIIAKSGDPNVTAINVLLKSRLFFLARVSRIIAMTCHVQVSLVCIFFYGLNQARVSPRIFVRVGFFLLLVFHDSNVVVCTQVIAVNILYLKFISSFKATMFSFTCFFHPVALVCFLAVIPLLALPILLHQLQEKKTRYKRISLL